MISRKSFAMFPLSLLLLLTVSACGGKQPAQQSAGDPSVTVVTLAPHPVTLSTELPGRTAAYLLSEVRPQVGGIVKKRLFREGGDVKAGQVLYQIDPATYRAAFDNARAALARAEANALPARIKAERYARLVGVRAVSKQDNDDAQAAAKQAAAEVLAAKAALETARIDLSYTRVTAPISGRIGKSTVTPGALVTASQGTALTTIQKTDPIYVDVTQSSTDVLRLKAEMKTGRLMKTAGGGARIRLILPDGSTYKHDGELKFKDITVDQSTGEVTLRSVFPNPDGDLLPGMYVRSVLIEGVDREALLVPQQSISRDPKGNATVMVVKPDDTVENRIVMVSRMIGNCWLVDSGLSAGERIVFEGLQKVHGGMKVKPIEAPAQPPAPQANAVRTTGASDSAVPAVPAGKAPGAAPPAVVPAASGKSVRQDGGAEPAKSPAESAKPRKKAAVKKAARADKTKKRATVRKAAVSERHAANATKPAVDMGSKGEK